MIDTNSPINDKIVHINDLITIINPSLIILVSLTRILYHPIQHLLDMKTVFQRDQQKIEGNIRLPFVEY